MSMSLRKRMTLLALLPAALVAGLLTALSLWHDIDNLEQGFRTRGNALSRQMATAAEYGIFSGQHANLLALTASTLTIDGSVRGAAIVDVNGAILALSGNVNPAAWPVLSRVEGQRLGSDVLLFVEPVLRSSLPVDDIYTGTDALGAPLTTVVGHVVVELSLAEISHESLRLAATGLLTALDAEGVPASDVSQDAVLRRKALTAYEAEKALELQSLRSRNESRVEALQDTVDRVSADNCPRAASSPKTTAATPRAITSSGATDSEA